MSDVKTDRDRDLCTECGTTYNWCTRTILGGGSACCGACGSRDTHPKKETAAERLERLGTDPKRWAKEFVSRFHGFAVRDEGLDEDTIARWFTNVLAVGEALGQYNSEKEEAEPPREPDEDMDWMVPDLVNHPPHYKGPAGIECIQVTEHMNFCLGNATKYVWRVAFGGKENDVEDLRKAVWYIEREIQERENKVT